MPSAIVIGGAGFIGSHLVDRLASQDWIVTVIDNVTTGTWENGVTWPDDQVLRVHHDITLPLPSFLEDAGPADVVIHLASPASPVQYRRLPLETLKVNSVGTERALEWARRWDARFIYTSTSEVYGDPDVSPQTESYWGRVNPNGPRACYDESKRFGEALCMEYYRQYAMDIRIVRLFNCYGPRMRLDDGRVVPNFVQQALRHQPLTVYGDGCQTRSFCYVDDTVDGIYRLMVRDGLAGEVINVGNPMEISIRQLADIVAKVGNRRIEVRYRPLPEDDPVRRCPDISKAQKLLNWNPQTDLITGLGKMYEYVESLLF